MNNVGTLCYFYGLKFPITLDILSQFKYIANILTSSRLSNTQVEDNPFELNAQCVSLPDLTLLRTLVGCLVYVTISI